MTQRLRFHVSTTALGRRTGPYTKRAEMIRAEPANPQPVLLTPDC